MPKPTEQECKNIIAAAMGWNFVDALYDGTTANTLLEHFHKSLLNIADHVERDGTIDLKSAEILLTLDNPGNQYRIDLFKSAIATRM